MSCLALFCVFLPGFSVRAPKAFNQISGGPRDKVILNNRPVRLLGKLISVNFGYKRCTYHQ